MPSPSRKADWPIIAALFAPVLLLVALVASYVVGYFVLPRTLHHELFTYRSYKTEWEAKLFEPAARIEWLITRQQTEVGFDGHQIAR